MTKENWNSRRKNSQSRVGNQQTEPKHGVGAEIEPRQKWQKVSALMGATNKLLSKGNDNSESLGKKDTLHSPIFGSHLQE